VVELKAWRDEASSAQWELRRFFAATLDRRPLALGRYLKREMDPARKLIASMFGDDGIQRPDLQCLKAGEEVPEDSKDQWTAYTASLLAVMAHEASSKHISRRREMPALILKAFLKMFIQPDPAATILENAKSLLPGSTCSEPPKRKCCHAGPILRKMEAVEDETPHQQLLECFSLLAVAAPNCISLRGIYGTLLQAASGAVEDFLKSQEWPEDALETLPVRTGRKRLGVVDKDFKKAAVNFAKKSKTSSVVNLLTVRKDSRASAAHHWPQDALREELSAAWLSWASGGVCYVCPDGFRCGTEDTVAFQFWHAQSTTGGWLPPQARPDCRQFCFSFLVAALKAKPCVAVGAGLPKLMRTFAPQVIRDYRKTKTRPGAEMSKAELADFREKLKSFFSAHATAATSNPKEKDKNLRLPTVLTLKATDHALQTGAGLSLSFFFHPRPLAKLLPNEVRYYVLADSLDNPFKSAGQLQRACILNKDTKATRLELIRDDTAVRRCETYEFQTLALPLTPELLIPEPLSHPKRPVQTQVPNFNLPPGTDFTRALTVDPWDGPSGFHSLL
jgi:hypothetical protein